MKFTTKAVLSLLFAVLINIQTTYAQDTLLIDDKDNITAEVKQVKLEDTLKKTTRFRVDGIAGVVGDYIVLDSDIDNSLLEMQQQNFSIEGLTRCDLFGRLLEDKLMAHHAIQDSIIVSDSEIAGRTDQQMEYIISQIGSEERVVEFYKKNSLEEVRRELFEINKATRLAVSMQEKIYEDIEITPEEIRQFFFAIPESERPIFGTELQLAQIVIEPEITEESRKITIDLLNEYRRDVVENGASFTTKAVLYSDEPSASTRGGFITMNKKSALAKEFKDVAFSLEEGEVSEPFETEFGYHIILLEKIRGQEIDVRHIVKIPEVSEETIGKARAKIDNIRNKIIAGEITFEEAARSESDEKETRNDGGQLINPQTFDTRFELTKMDPVLSAQVYNLADGQISNVLVDDARNGRKRFKILTVTNRLEEHVADYAKDYEKIRELALTQKRIKAIEKWQAAKIKETYISINADFVECDFANNWLQK